MAANLRIARTKTASGYADALAEATARLKHAKDAVAAAEEIKNEREAEVMTILASAGRKSATVPMDEMRFRVTVVQNERLDVNEASLRKALSAPVFDKLCDLKLNRSKLEEAIAEGRVDPLVVSINTTVNKTRAYVRLTPVKGSET